MASRYIKFMLQVYLRHSITVLFTRATKEVSSSYPNKRADSAVCVGADGILIEVLLLIVLISFCSLKFAIMTSFQKTNMVKIITKTCNQSWFVIFCNYELFMRAKACFGVCKGEERGKLPIK